MSSSADVEGILGKAVDLEKKYEWLEASRIYEQALRLVDEENYFRRGEIQEKKGRCLHRATFQAESRDKFLERLKSPSSPPIARTAACKFLIINKNRL